MANSYAYEQIANQQMFDWLSTDGMEKRAEDAINAFTRLKVREDGVHRRIQDYLPIGNDQLDRNESDKPQKWVDKEPDGPPAISVPFATLPMNVYIKGPRYRVLFGRIWTPRFTKDVDELRTWHMDIRQVLSDNAIKDMLYEEDIKWFAAVNFAMGSAADATSPMSGTVQWKTIPGGVTRDGVRDAFKILPGGPARLQPHTVLINHVSIHEIMKWGRDEMGGNLSEDMMKTGFTEANFMNARWIITIKDDLVPNDVLFMFGDQKFLGKAYVLEDTCFWIKREGPMIEYSAYETIGSALANAGAVGRSDLAA